VYVAIEGIDGSGKTTLAKALVERLKRKGIGVVHTREPGGGLEELRELVLTKDLSPEAEYLLFSADRAEHLRRVVVPALKEGKWVVSERSFFSSLAYQGYGRGLDLDWMLRVAERAAPVWPHLVFLLDVSPAVALSRLPEERDRIERKGLEFLDRVRRGYLALAERYSHSFVVLQGDADPGSLAEVAKSVALAFLRARRGR